jgi:PTS system cellobiose-specific IIC component
MAVGGPFSGSPTFTDTASMGNMNAALKAGNSWNVPYKYTDTTLFHSFANFGGSGVMIALIIAILIFSKKQRTRNVSHWSIFPAIFNNHYAMMLGIPVLFNPVFLLPFIIVPLFNMLVAAIFISLHWIPIAAYPVPLGTPGPLIAFIGTNGNWLTLILGAFLLVIDVLVYWPFVKLSDQISQKAGEIDEN